MPAAPAATSHATRIEALARFQEAILRHALSFPAVQRVVYSTCSVERRENEDVVARVLAPGSACAAQFDLVPALPEWPRRGLPPPVPGEGEEVGVGEVAAAHLDERRTRKCVRCLFPDDYTIGFFVALFERRKEGAAALSGAGERETPTPGDVEPSKKAKAKAKAKAKKKKAAEPSTNAAAAHSEKAVAEAQTAVGERAGPRLAQNAATPTAPSAATTTTCSPVASLLELIARPTPRSTVTPLPMMVEHTPAPVAATPSPLVQRKRAPGDRASTSREKRRRGDRLL